MFFFSFPLTPFLPPTLYSFLSPFIPYFLIQASLAAQWQRFYLQCSRHGFDTWVRKIPSKRKWEHTPVFLPGKSHGQRSLMGYGPLSHKESDVTERRPEIIIGTRGKLWKKTDKSNSAFLQLMVNCGEVIGRLGENNKENKSENNMLDCNNSSGEKLSK